jgi:hypothetical protein
MDPRSRIPRYPVLLYFHDPGTQLDGFDGPPGNITVELLQVKSPILQAPLIQTGIRTVGRF